MPERRLAFVIMLRHSSFVIFPVPFSPSRFSLILRGMNHVRRTCWCVSVFFLAGPAWGQWGGAVPSSQFELADTVQLDQVDNTVLAQWERVKALLADRQWDEAVEILRQLAESSEGKLLGVTNRRYVSLREWCQLQLAALPPEALKLYRARVDPVAQKWYEQGIAERNRRLLENVVQQAFASKYGDDALMALGEMSLESGDYVAARWYWERILPVAKNGSDIASQNAPHCNGGGPAMARLSRYRPRPGGRACPAGVGVDPRRRDGPGEGGTGRVHPSAPRRAGSVGRPGRAVRRSVEKTVGRKPILACSRRPIRTGPRLRAIPSGTRSRPNWSTSAPWRGARGCVPRLPRPTARWNRQPSAKTRTSR